MSEHSFCRAYLKECMENVRTQGITKDTIKNSWAYNYEDSRMVEFHVNKCTQVPDSFYWWGRSCCCWIAKAKGWTAFLEQRNKETNTDGQET